jgi:hypothetical protein
MRRADPYNLLRLMRAFPLYGVAFVLWDTGRVAWEYDTGDAGRPGYVPWPTDVRLQGDHRLHLIAQALRRPTYREQLDELRLVCDPARTHGQGGQQMTDAELAAHTEFGA